jgi:hypothetical protein
VHNDQAAERDAAGGDPSAEGAQPEPALQVEVGQPFRVRGQVGAARNAATVTARTPRKIEVGLSQLDTRLPAALPTGTRREAIPPTTVPSANTALGSW